MILIPHENRCVPPKVFECMSNSKYTIGAVHGVYRYRVNIYTYKTH